MTANSKAATRAVKNFRISCCDARSARRFSASYTNAGELESKAIGVENLRLRTRVLFLRAFETWGGKHVLFAGNYCFGWNSRFVCYVMAKWTFVIDKAGLIVSLEKSASPRHDSQQVLDIAVQLASR